MKKLFALPEGAGTPIFGLQNRLANLVSPETRDHERSAVRGDCYRVSWQNWRSVCRQRIKNLAFLTASHWKAIY